jgi:hypothetical protein
MVRRLLGNQLYQPGASLPATCGGYPTGLLLAAAINPEARLRLVDRMPADSRSSLNERSLSSDTVEGRFAGVHGQCGYRPPAATVVGRAARLEWRAQVRAMPEEDRGFAMPAASRTYECAPADGASSAASWNDGRVHYLAAAAAHYAANLARNFKRKVASSFFLITRDVHKRMRQ